LFVLNVERSGKLSTATEFNYEVAPLTPDGHCFVMDVGEGAKVRHEIADARTAISTRDGLRD
jgi:hypothetical protein